MRTIWTVAAVLIACLANSALAQELRGMVRDSATLEVRADRSREPPAIGVVEIKASLVSIVLQFKNAPP